jgi:hypothetical protein
MNQDGEAGPPAYEQHMLSRIKLTSWSSPTGCRTKRSTLPAEPKMFQREFEF